MKKVLVIGLTVLVVVGIGAVAAEYPVGAVVEWDGSGWLKGTITSSDDADTIFETAGDAIIGKFTSQQTENVSYPYMGVDSYSCYIDATVQGGTWVDLQQQPIFAYIDLNTNRNDTYGSYSPAGAFSHSYVRVWDGTGQMGTGTATNFSQLLDCTWAQPKTDGGYNFESSATLYDIYKKVENADGDFGFVNMWGNGDAELHCLSCEAGHDVNLANGCGCNNCQTWMASATADATGVTNGFANFKARAEGNEYARNWLTGDGSTGVGSYYEIKSGGQTVNISNYAMESK